VLVGLVVAVLLAACGDGSATAVRDVSVDEAVELAGDVEVTVVDVRTPEEFAAGHLPGAVNIDVQDPSFADRIAELPKDGRYLVYCRTGNRSAAASAQMVEAGFTDVTNVTGGGYAELAAASG